MNDCKKVSTLQERDLELKKQLNDINSASIEKLMKKAPELPVVQTKTKKLMTGTPQAIGDLALRDLAFQVQLDDIAEKAVGGKDIVPSKVNREITPEMIADFEDAKKVPIDIGGTQYSYNPSALNIDIVDPVFHVLSANFKNEEEIKDENSIYAESYENSNVSESMSKENKQNEEIENDVDTYGYDSVASHHSMNNKNYLINNDQRFKNGKKKRFENSTGESSGTSSWSNYTDHSNSLINLHSSPASSTSSSSSSNNTPSNNNTDNSRLNYLSSQKTNIEKKINFAIISTLVD